MYFIIGLGYITVKIPSDNSPAYGHEEKIGILGDF